MYVGAEDMFGAAAKDFSDDDFLNERTLIMESTGAQAGDARIGK